MLGTASGATKAQLPMQLLTVVTHWLPKWVHIAMAAAGWRS
jgi:hypothetical protein